MKWRCLRGLTYHCRSIAGHYCALALNNALQHPEFLLSGSPDDVRELVEVKRAMVSNGRPVGGRAALGANHVPVDLKTKIKTDTA